MTEMEIKGKVQSTQTANMGEAMYLPRGPIYVVNDRGRSEL